MTNNKSTKRALLTSGLAMFVCVAMLIGSTFAWFTDSVTSGRNQIVAGNLDVELYHGDSLTEKVDGATNLFTNADGTAIRWEPGVIAYENFKVENVGSLALKYQLTMNIAGYNTVKDTELSLVDVLKVAILDGTFSGDRTAAQNLEFNWTLSDFVKDGVLLSKESDTYAVVIYWEPGANDNDYNLNNGKESSDGEPLYVDLGVTLAATQTPYEADSFNDQYDKDAKYPVVDAESLKTTLVDGGVINLGASFNMMNENTVAGRNQINADTVLNLNNETLTFRNAATDDDPTNISAIYAENFDLTLNAENGGIDSDFYGINVGDASNAAAVQPTVTINGGTYKAGSVVNVESGTVYITGGFFDGRDVYGDRVNATYLLNCIDRCYKAGNAKIVVTGGTFVNFNPANNSAEGAGTNFVPEGYTVQTTADGANTLYTVVA